MKLTSAAILLAAFFTQTVLAQSTGRVFVTNERSNTVSVIMVQLIKLKPQ